MKKIIFLFFLSLTFVQCFSMPYWLQRTSKDWAGGIMGGMGGAGFGPVGVAVGYCCGAYIGSMELLPPIPFDPKEPLEIKNDINPYKKLGVDHNILLKKSLSDGKCQKDFDYIKSSSLTLGYVIPATFTQSSSSDFCQKVNSIPLTIEAFVSLSRNYKSAEVISLHKTLVNKLFTVTTINDFNNLMLENITKANTLTTDEKESFLKSLAVLQYSGNFWYVNNK